MLPVELSDSEYVGVTLRNSLDTEAFLNIEYLNKSSVTVAVTVTVTVTDNLLQHELQKSLHPSPVAVSRLLRDRQCVTALCICRSQDRVEEN